MVNDVLSGLPEELLESIVLYLSPADTIAFGSTCKRCDKVTHEALVWRRHCMEGWHFWLPHHQLAERIALPPIQTRWHHVFNQRRRTDEEALAKFNTMLLTQQYRNQRIEELTAIGYDIKDLMLDIENNTPDDAVDVLARTYHARMIRCKLHRDLAIKQWIRLQERQMVSLDAALGAFDLFVLAGQPADLDGLDRELQRLANAVVQSEPDFHSQSTRVKTLAISRYLHSESLLGNGPLFGNGQTDDYHNLRNNYITLALFRTPHRSLPLQSAVIFCGVARRLGVDARPSNFPHHVYVVVQPPRDQNLDGRPKPSDMEDEREYMYMDPWRTYAEEVEQEDLVSRLTQMGTQPAQYATFLGPASTMEVVARTGRNIVNSVTESRTRLRVTPPSRQEREDRIDVERAWYSMLWATMLVGDNNVGNTLNRRRSCLPYLMEHYQVHFPEDLDLIERHIAPMFKTSEEHASLLQLVSAARKGDDNKKAPSPRSKATAHVAFQVGNHFQHKRYGYTGVVIGWDARCEAGEQWISQMRVNELPKGREQPFYHVLADDKSVRYVAQENIGLVDSHPESRLLNEAGRYFKRWDAENQIFVSNIEEEYPDN